MRRMPKKMSFGMGSYYQRGMGSSAPQERQCSSDPCQRSRNDPRDLRKKLQQQQQHRQSNSYLLTDDQNAILPPEQRSSILVLKEQIAKSASLK